FVRNPFDRLVSCWLNKALNREKNTFKLDALALEHIQTFSGFIDYVERLDIKTCNVHIRSQSSLIDLTNIDYIGRMENFSADVNEVLNMIGLPVNRLKARNVSKARTSYQNYYSADDVERVYRLYQKDCQIFGYSF
ncbi:MAG: sulfotransferase family protein, partial [Cycloclasticus sp.]|nr:sulfotransferase family protein [Cycloclasticus sp.]